MQHKLHIRKKNIRNQHTSLYTRDPEMAFDWQLIWAERTFYARPRSHNSQVSAHVDKWATLSSFPSV